MKLQERALLVRLTVHQWNGQKTDRKVTEEVAVTHSAERDAGRYSKQLISKKALKKITSICSGARTSHYVLTLPWSDDGNRIISTEGYQHYADNIRGYRQRLEDAVDEFLINYNEHVKEAKIRLGTMFDEEDYPDPDTLYNKFSFEVEENSVPSASDFRAKVSDEEAKVIMKDIERRSEQRLKQAMNDVWQRIFKVAERMAEKLESYVPANAKGISAAENHFRNSLVDNVKELADLLPSFNLDNDKKLNELHKEILEDLCKYDAEELRQDDKARRQTAKKAAAIRDKVSKYMM